jgi:hypothetical protein
MNYQQQALGKRITHNEIALIFIDGSIALSIEWIKERFGCFFKSNALLCYVNLGFVIIPFKLDTLKSIENIHKLSFS